MSLPDSSQALVIRNAPSLEMMSHLQRFLGSGLGPFASMFVIAPFTSCTSIRCGWIIAIMRFTRGCKIEVLSKREVSFGSWRPAVIISGNGHNYTVRYERLSADEPVIGWVSRKAIRPSPPVKVTNWFSGDVVEVFHNFSWKLATILKGLGENQALVRLHGSLDTITINLDDIRVRQSWENDEWIVMGKRSLNCEGAKHYNMWAGSTLKLKSSSPNWLAEYESSEGAAKKYRQVEIDGQINRVMENCIPSDEHGHSLHQCKMEGKKRGRTSLMIRFPAVAQRNESNQLVGSLSAVRRYSNDEDSDLCSIGSCSTSDSWEQIHYGHADDSNGDLSDAESSNAPSHDKKNRIHESQEEAAAARIHQFELHGYRSTLRALYASGPLSWEQQSLIRPKARACARLYFLMSKGGASVLGLPLL